MAHLIDKSAVVAEIERRLNYRIKSLKAINDGTYQKEGQGDGEFNESLTRCAFNEVKNELFELKCFIDTLKVKEMDLEKELDSMITPELKFHKALPSLFDVAKHFFELGLKAQKGE